MDTEQSQAASGHGSVDSQEAAAPGPAPVGISITDTAAAQGKVLLEKRGTPGGLVRVGIKGGGCTGLAYVVEFEDRPPGPQDRVFEKAGFRVVVDPKSLLYLNGAELDYVKTLAKTGFRLTNPNVKKACGCGESFSV